MILDRTFDLTGPIMHSYATLSQIDQFMNGNPRMISQPEDIAATCFNEDDPYWQLYKTANSGAAREDLEE